MSRLVVRYRAEAEAQEVARLEEKLGVLAVRRIAPLRICAYDDRPGLAEALEKEPLVDYVEREEELTIK